MNGDLTLAQLLSRMRDAGVTRLYAKRLAENDNSKNQVYLGPDFSALNVLPVGQVSADPADHQILKAPVTFLWLTEGRSILAPNAQVILYPQYPEVRMSSFLQGASGAPAELIRQRLAGRVLFFGVAGTRVFGYVTAPDTQLARGFEAAARRLQPVGVFFEIPMLAVDPRHGLATALRAVQARGWIDSHRMLADGTTIPCNAPNCGGYTLEALLGIRPQGASEPDFQGWEVKTHAVTAFSRAASASAITLMTPEPTGGFYRTEGPERFLRRYGYADSVRGDRINFSGRHFECIPSARSRLHMVLEGFDKRTNRITDASGGIVLRDGNGRPAAIWHYASLLSHWNRKHALAAYIATCRRVIPRLQYRFGTVRLGEGTSFELFLRALVDRRVYYDPGLKLENASSAAARAKRRSQFRIASRDLPAIYHTMTAL